MDVNQYFKDNLMPNLKKEIDAYIKLMDDLEEKQDGTDVITYNEIAMASLVKSAFIRGEEADKVWALQEYGVFDKSNSAKGRGDLFVAIRKDELTCDLLIEAKRDGEFNPSLDPKDTSWYEDLSKAMDQGESYFKPEEKYFIKPTFVVTMFFCTLNHDSIKKYNNLVFPENEKLNKLEHYQFEIQLDNSPRILSVYGQIKEVKPAI